MTKSTSKSKPSDLEVVAMPSNIDGAMSMDQPNIDHYNQPAP